MVDVIITGSGMHTPETVLTNEELVSSFNQYVDRYNQVNQSHIERGLKAPLKHSSCDFIQKASGILARHVIDKEGILDINTMRPQINDRSDDMISIQAEFAIQAAKKALRQAHKKPTDIDAIIVGASAFQRSFPAIAIEVQAALGTRGFAFDMNVACSSATFAITTAENYIKQGAASNVLVINPEIMTGLPDFKDRQTHFIFGDGATALVLEGVQDRQSVEGFKLLDSRIKTIFSNNIRFNGGYLDRLLIDSPAIDSRLFRQNGRQVFKEVMLEVVEFIKAQLASLCLTPEHFKRLWLHQANRHMNGYIAKKFFEANTDDDKVPIVLDRYANTGAAGSVMAFHLYSDDFESGEKGLLCSFGAGYSVGSIVLEKM